MRNQYVSVRFGNARDIKAEPIYQYDHGLILSISDVRPDQIQQAHYAVANQSKTIGLQLMESNGWLEARIPDNLTAKGETIYAYLYFEDDHAGYTVRTIEIPVIPRERPGVVMMEAPDSTKVGQLAEDLENLISEATGAIQTATQAADNAQSKSQQAQEVVDKAAAQFEEMRVAISDANAATDAANTAAENVEAKTEAMQNELDRVSSDVDAAKASAAAAQKAAEDAAEAAANIDLTEVYSAIDGKAGQDEVDTVAGKVSSLENSVSSLSSTVANKVDKVPGKGLSTNDYTTAEKQKLAGIEANANNYIHPTHQAYESGFYKVQVDSQGHVTGAVPVTAEDINALGIEPAPPATYHEVTLLAGSWQDGAQDVTVAESTATSKVVVLETDEYALTSDLYWQASAGKVTFLTDTVPWSDVPVKFLLMQTPEGD